VLVLVTAPLVAFNIACEGYIHYHFFEKIFYTLSFFFHFNIKTLFYDYFVFCRFLLDPKVAFALCPFIVFTLSNRMQIMYVNWIVNVGLELFFKRNAKY
jgi:hypothetical protein